MRCAERIHRNVRHQRKSNRFEATCQHTASAVVTGVPRPFRPHGEREIIATWTPVCTVHAGKARSRGERVEALPDGS